jgi:hypothetical protein
MDGVAGEGDGGDYVQDLRQPESFLEGSLNPLKSRSKRLSHFANHETGHQKDGSGPKSAGIIVARSRVGSVFGLRACSSSCSATSVKVTALSGYISQLAIVRGSSYRTREARASQSAAASAPSGCTSWAK